MKKQAKKAPKKKATAKKTKTARRRKSSASARGPKLVITLLSDCTLDNNQHLFPPHASQSPDGGFPNHVQFKGEIDGWFCVPGGYLYPEPANPPGSAFEVGPGNPSRAFKVVDPAPTPVMHFRHSCDAPCARMQDVNGDEILIDA